MNIKSTDLKNYIGLSFDSSVDFKIGIVVNQVNASINKWTGYNLEGRTEEEKSAIDQHCEMAAYQLGEMLYMQMPGVSSYSDAYTEKISFDKNAVGSKNLKDTEVVSLGGIRVTLQIYRGLEDYLLPKYRMFSGGA